MGIILPARTRVANLRFEVRECRFWKHAENVPDENFYVAGNEKFTVEQWIEWILNGVNN